MVARVVVTGMGMLTAVGNDVSSTWQALCEGRSGVAPIAGYDASEARVRIGAEIKHFEPGQYMERKEVRRTAPMVHFAVAAARQALQQARLTISAENAVDIGVCVTGILGGLSEFYDAYLTLVCRGPERISPFSIHLMIINTAASFISIMTGAQGPNFSVVSAHASASNAIGEAWEIIRRGDAKAMIVGGSEKSVVPMAMAAFDNMGALSRNNTDPAGACRPFDQRRDGFVMGEGAGVLILEDLEFARARNAPILAELIGYGSIADAYHTTRPDTTGRGLARSIERALQKAGISPQQVDYINAHGTSTLLNDRVETQVIKNCFGEYALRVPISATKSMLGHTLGASGAIGAIVSIMTIQSGIIHPTINLERRDPDCDLDYVPQRARRAQVDIALANAVGFGGHNSCLVFRRYSDG